MPRIAYPLVLMLAVSIAACGKYSPPRPPEDFSPNEVKNFQVVASLGGVKFNWEAPEKDLRDKELKSIDGYRIYRKDITRDSDILDDSIEYELITTLEDTHLVELDKLREEAREAGKPTRRLKPDDALIKFEYTDIDVKAGKSYVYKLIPFNQGDVEGNYTKLIRVLFRGDGSDVMILPFTAFEEQVF